MGSFLGQWAGWRWTFGLLSVLGALVACGLLRATEESRPGPDPSGEGPAPAQGWLRSAGRAFLAPRVPVYVLATFLNMFGFYGMYTYLGSALQFRFGSGSSMTGAMILLYGLGFSTSFVTGRWADERGKERVLVALLAGLVPALALIPFVVHWTALLVLCLFLWGAMQSLVVTVLSTLLSESSPSHRGTILAFYSLATNLAVALGAALLGPLFIAHGFSAVGWVCAAVTLVAFALSVWAHRRGDGRAPAGDGDPVRAVAM
jgi:predicted MFS family arabinose efflux permease